MDHILSAQELEKRMLNVCTFSMGNLRALILAVQGSRDKNKKRPSAEACAEQILLLIAGNLRLLETA